MRLTLVLYFLRYVSFRHLALLFKISVGHAHTEIKHVLPFLVEAVQDEIRLPDWEEEEIGFGGSQFLIDCSPHVRDRVHPGQALYYRGDKKCHFLTAQVVCSIRGKIQSVVIALGHNNDQGLFNKTFSEYVQA